MILSPQVKHLLPCFVSLILMACDAGDKVGAEADKEADTSVADGGRWYTSRQQETGAAIFADNCARCHGNQAQGLVENWRQRLDDGSLPPPPLNGSAHTWHHPLSVLLQVINEGGVPLGGSMPAFESVLSEEQKLAVIAYFQSFWSEEIYAQWQQMGGID